MQNEKSGQDMTAEQRRLLVVLGICAMTGAMAIRIPDPVVPLIAQHFSVAITTAALLATAFALPYGLCQPILGPLGDAWGKLRVLRWCMVLLTAALTASALAPSMDLLFISRIVGGVAGGGLIPLGIAAIGDTFDGSSRQIALSRLIAAATVGTLVGLTSSGIIAELVGWRGPFWLAAIVAAGATVAVFTSPAARPTATVSRVSLAGLRGGYRAVLSNPRAPVCFGAVFIEGIAVYSVFPFVAEILSDRGVGGPAQAGLVIGAFGIAGIVFSLAVGALLRRFSPFGLMVAGGLFAATGLLLFSIPAAWPFAAFAFFVLGLGFFSLHNGLQTRATMLAPSARGSAVALHAFCFFLGQAVAPMLLGPFLHGPAASVTLTLAACLMAATGAGAAILLRRIDARDATAPRPGA